MLNDDNIRQSVASVSEACDQVTKRAQEVLRLIDKMEADAADMHRAQVSAFDAMIAAINNIRKPKG